ncbi:hypothetical protein [Neobacillus sp. D3-1R]|uniref:hypothetical protein n=1 Tax=Neobacillus sp. D3-1R TaxID=3445778 RepID=UPI003FA128D3
MTTLTEEQYSLVKQYSELLTTVEEAFQYIIESFNNYERTEGDQVLADVFLAFAQIADANSQLATTFPNEVNQFNEVIKAAQLLEPVFTNQTQKQQLIQEKLYPAFHTWSQTIQEKLKPLYTV